MVMFEQYGKIISFDFKNQNFVGVPIVAQQKQIQLVSM